MGNSTLADAWPPARIVVRGPRVELRLPTEAELLALVDLAAAGIHDASTMPFALPWSDAEPDVLRREALRWHWRARAMFAADDWNLLFAVLVDGVVVGAQDLHAKAFATTRELGTGSWLGRAHQGQGLGSEMRRAVLEFAFTGLGAEAATSGAYAYNEASQRVSRAVGYEVVGREQREVTRGPRAAAGSFEGMADELQFRITRERWLEHRRDGFSVHGVDGDVRAMLGLDAPATD